MAQGTIKGGVRLTRTHASMSVFVTTDGVEWQATIERTPAFDALPSSGKAAALLLAVKAVRDAQLAAGVQTLVNTSTVTL